MGMWILPGEERLWIFRYGIDSVCKNFRGSRMPDQLGPSTPTSLCFVRFLGPGNSQPAGVLRLGEDYAQASSITVYRSAHLFNPHILSSVSGAEMLASRMYGSNRDVWPALAVRWTGKPCPKPFSE